MTLMRTSALILLATLTATSTVTAEDTSAAEWQSISVTSRLFYVAGFKAGADAALQFVYEQSPKNKNLINGMVDLLGVDMSNEAIEAVATALYQDPANAYINPEDAVRIAMLKIKGRDVEKELQGARRLGLALKPKVKQGGGR
jgi:hypothetical protein